MRTLLSLTMLAVVGCTGGPEEEDCWWCDDTTDDVETDDDTDDKDTDGKDTDDKDTDDKDTDGENASGTWTGTLDSATGFGTFDYEGETCALSYAISKASEAEGCEVCDFAWSLTLGEVTVTAGEECAGRDSYAGIVISFGHEDPSTLWGTKGEDWAANGTSKVHEGIWYFGVPESGKGGGK
jgi:hypothetical protein